MVLGRSSTVARMPSWINKSSFAFCSLYTTAMKSQASHTSYRHATPRIMLWAHGNSLATITWLTRSTDLGVHSPSPTQASSNSIRRTSTSMPAQCEGFCNSSRHSLLNSIHRGKALSNDHYVTPHTDRPPSPSMGISSHAQAAYVLKHS